MGKRRITAHVRVQILARDRYRCLMCGRSRSEVALEVDHIKPVAEGGTDEIENLGTLCHDCNRGKGAYTFSNYGELPFAPTGPEPSPQSARWRAILGKPIRIEPLTGHPQWPAPDPWFLVEEVTTSDVRLKKRSTEQSIRVPLSALGAPWGAEAEGGMWATVERGTLRFATHSDRWEWTPCGGSELGGSFPNFGIRRRPPSGRA